MNHPLRFAIRFSSLLLLLVFAFNSNAFAQRRASAKTCDPADGRIEYKHDRFSDRTGVTLKPIVIYDAGDERIVLSATYDPRRQSRVTYIPHTALFEFEVTTRKHRFSLVRFDVLFLVDGERMEPSPASGRMDIEARPLPPGAIRPQVVSSIAELDTLRKIGAGKRVDIKAGEMEFTPTAAALEALSAFAECAKAASGQR